jgi:hypothetical protein
MAAMEKHQANDRAGRHRIGLRAVFLAMTAAALSLGWAVVVQSHLAAVHESRIAAKQARLDAQIAQSMAEAARKRSSANLQNTP